MCFSFLLVLLEQKRYLSNNTHARTNLFVAVLSHVDRAPALPRGAVRGCSYLKWRVEGRFSLSPGWSPTPPNSMLNRLSSSRGSPWCFFFFERIRFQDFFYFFVEKTLLLMKNQHFIIIITFHQITHQLVLSIFTWDFIFSSKFSL